jgi:predicted phosphodiesterase
VLVLSDLHIPYHSVSAIEAALDFGRQYNPDAVLINGDLFDFFQISRFDKNPTLPKVSAELSAGGEFFDHLRHQFPKAGLYFKLGNHDERWEHYIWKAAPLLSDIPDIVKGWEGPAGVVRNKVSVIRDQRPVMLGKLRVLHGHEKGRGVSSPVNQARGAFLRLLSSVLEGHGHRTSEHTERTADGATISCRSTGCLCGLHPDYARVNKWDHGFATVDVAKDGNYVCRLHRIIDGKVY